MFLLEHLWIIPALPLLGAALNGIFLRRQAHAVVNSVALGSTALAFASALELFREFSALVPASIPVGEELLPVDLGGRFSRRLCPASGPAHYGDVAGRHRCGLPHPYLFHRLYGT